MPSIVGGCLCGDVRYEGEAEPLLTAVCHCRDCQKHTSSAFSVLVVLPKGGTAEGGARPGSLRARREQRATGRA
jgi:hypothetical protein